jgi:creatinine amidohydrolase
VTYWLHELRRPQVEDYLAGNDIVLLPIGSVEQHGRHLPLMTDAAQAIAVAEGVAARTGVLIAPPVWYGWSPFHLCYPGSLTLRPETLSALVEDILNSLIHGGFARIVIISGHTTMNYIPVDPVALRIRQNTGALVATVDVGLIAKREIAAVLKSSYDGHAGEWETSFMLHKFPDFVDMGEAVAHVPEPDRALFPALVPGDPRIEGNTYQLYPTVEEYAAASAPGAGITGDATLATKQQGEIVYEAMVRNTIAVLEKARKHPVTIRNRCLPI